MSRDDCKVVLAPVGRTREEVAAIWATIDALRGGEDLFPDVGFEDAPAQADGRTFSDE